MSQQELLARVVAVLGTLGIEYMVTGSFASSLYGEPRSTHDIDLIVLLPVEAVEPLLAAFPPPAFYLSKEAVMDGLRQRSMFNLISLDDGEKVDFWMLTEAAFDQARFVRKCLKPLFGTPMFIASAEDTILSKLRWTKLSGGSEKQMRDALRVFEVQRNSIDIGYINQWANQLGVQDLWQQIQTEAEPL